MHRRGQGKYEVTGGLIKHWALGGNVWTLPQLILQFVTTAKDGFVIPKKLGCGGGERLLPIWVDEVFPPPFVISDPTETRQLVCSISKQFSRTVNCK